MDTARWLLLLLLGTAGCEEHGRTPTFLHCSPKWLTVVEQCEKPCVDPDLLTTNTSCWRGDSAENVEFCEQDRFANIDGHQGCCVFTNARVEFVDCNKGMPPVSNFPDAPISFPDAGMFPN